MLGPCGCAWHPVLSGKALYSTGTGTPAGVPAGSKKGLPPCGLQLLGGGGGPCCGQASEGGLLLTGPALRARGLSRQLSVSDLLRTFSVHCGRV